MATSKDYKEYILSILSPTGYISVKPMMGEYLLYYDGVHIGGLYDDRLLIKEIVANDCYRLKSERPYDGAKRTMRVIDDFSDVEFLRNVFTATAEQLKRK